MRGQALEDGVAFPEELEGWKVGDDRLLVAREQSVTRRRVDRARDRGGPEEHGVDDAENRRGKPYPKRQYTDGERHKCRRSTERRQAEYVVPEAIEHVERTIP